MSPTAMETFTNYSWPGNVSELINVIERFVIMIQDDQIKASHLPLLVELRETQLANGKEVHQSLQNAEDQFQRDYIKKALVRHNWNVNQTALSLQIEKDQLHEKIKNLGISFLS